MDIPSAEPTSIRSGDTVQWNKSFDEYPADSGWSLVYTLTLQSDFSKRLQVTASTSGRDYLVTLSAAQTAALPAGTYNLFGHVSNGSERYQVFASTIELKPNLAAMTTGDGRSDIKKKLDAIEAVIMGSATVDQQSLQINGRAISRYSMADKLLLRDRLKADYQKELQAEQFGRTGINPRRIGVRFAHAGGGRRRV